MNIGTLDRQIRIERITSTSVDSAGTPVPTWTLLKIVWARVVPMSGSESLRVERQVSSEISRFFIRYYSDLTVKDRISYNDKYWDIQNIRELGRREGLEILGEHVV